MWAASLLPVAPGSALVAPEGQATDKREATQSTPKRGRIWEAMGVTWCLYLLASLKVKGVNSLTFRDLCEGKRQEVSWKRWCVCEWEVGGRGEGEGNDKVCRVCGVTTSLEHWRK